MIEQYPSKISLRVLRFLRSEKNADICDFGSSQDLQTLLISLVNRKSRMVCPHGLLDALHKAALIARDEFSCSLLPLGEKRIKRAEAVEKGALDGGFQAQHQNIKKDEIFIRGEKHTVTINQNESPLTRLRSKKCVNGRPWVNDSAFAAGEKLRTDFARGQLQQKVTSSWNASIGGAATKAGAGGKADLTDMAIDARDRFNQAIKFVGPDLAGVVTDVCCFLKGLETIERERRWPPRSAKLMLRTALDLLARHYGTDAGFRGNLKPQ